MATSGSPRGQARVDPADDGGAVAVHVEQLDDDDPEHDRDQRSGNHRSDPPQPQDQRQRHQPEQQRQPVGLVELAEQVPELSKKSPSPSGTPNSLGSCPTTIVRARPMMKPLSTGSEMKLATKPSRSQPGDDPDDAGGDRQRDGQGGEPAAALGRQLGDGGRRQGRGGRHRPHDQVPGAAEGGIQHQRGPAPRTARPPARPPRSRRRPAPGVISIAHTVSPARPVALQPASLVAGQRREQPQPHDSSSVRTLTGRRQIRAYPPRVWRSPWD